MPVWPLGGSGGAAEAFSYVVSHTTATISGVATLTSGSNAFKTAGVSRAGNTITLPAGLWLIGFDIEATWWSGLPTYGDFSFGAAPNSTPSTVSYMAQLDHQDFNWSGKAPSLSGSNLFNLTANKTLNAYWYNDMDATVNIFGSVWGVQVPAGTVTVNP